MRIVCKPSITYIIAGLPSAGHAFVRRSDHATSLLGPLTCLCVSNTVSCIILCSILLIWDYMIMELSTLQDNRVFCIEKVSFVNWVVQPSKLHTLILLKVQVQPSKHTAMPSPNNYINKTELKQRIERTRSINQESQLEWLNMLITQEKTSINITTRMTRFATADKTDEL